MKRSRPNDGVERETGEGGDSGFYRRGRRKSWTSLREGEEE